MYQGFAYQISRVMPAVRNSGLLVSTFSAFSPDGVLTSTGAASGNFVPVVDLQNIACTSAVTSHINIAPTELRELEDILTKAPRHVVLDADYTELLAGWRDGWEATIVYQNGVVTRYQIVGVEQDSQTTHTRLELMEVSV